MQRLQKLLRKAKLKIQPRDASMLTLEVPRDANVRIVWHSHIWSRRIDDTQLSIPPVKSCWSFLPNGSYSRWLGDMSSPWVWSANRCWRILLLNFPWLAFNEKQSKVFERNLYCTFKWTFVYLYPNNVDIFITNFQKILLKNGFQWKLALNWTLVTFSPFFEIPVKCLKSGRT